MMYTVMTRLQGIICDNGVCSSKVMEFSIEVLRAIALLVLSPHPKANLFVYHNTTQKYLYIVHPSPELDLIPDYNV